MVSVERPSSAENGIKKIVCNFCLLQGVIEVRTFVNSSRNSVVSIHIFVFDQIFDQLG